MVAMSIVPTFQAITRVLDDPTTSRWRGPCAPFTDNPRGAFESRGTRSVIFASIVSILSTPIGTRVYLPEFGSRLTSLPFEPNDELLAALAETYIRDAIAKWEPRVEVLEVECFRDRFRDDVLNVRMSWSLLEDSVVDRLTLRLGPSGVLVNVEAVP